MSADHVIDILLAVAMGWLFGWLHGILQGEYERRGGNPPSRDNHRRNWE